MPFHRVTQAEIDLSAFRHNLKQIQLVVGADVRVMAVVKADAYGHGAVACAKEAMEAGAHALAVAHIEEAIELREKGLQGPILILGGVFPDEIDELIQFNLDTTLYSQSLAKLLAGKAQKAGKEISVHLKIDTGMNRLGIAPEDFSCFLQRVKEYPALRLQGICTHLSSADEDDPEFTQQQLAKFNSVLQSAGENLFVDIHCANSAALLKFPESRFNMVRPGITLYGALTSPSLQPAAKKIFPEPLRPVMRWTTKVTHLRNVPAKTPLSYGRQFITQRASRIATLPVGYADGLLRCLSNKMQVLVRGQAIPQVGTICMDFILIDVTDLPDVQEGDEVVLLGQQGGNEISADLMAQWANTISYEVLCSVGKRIPRNYLP
jgi:alanine racemase